MSDWLTIHRLRLCCHIGVPEQERTYPQMLEATLRFKVDAAAAAAGDDLARTVNYYEVAQRAKAIAAARPRQLIETLAEDLASGLMEDFGLPRIEVVLRKFILPDSESVELEISRKRKKPPKAHKLRLLEPPAEGARFPGESPI
jgi:dihydroneopterin aldolase